MDKKRLMRIGELAQRTNVPVETIRYYSDIGVMSPTVVTESGYRYYSTEDSMRLELIRALRDAGISLPLIKEILQDKDKTSAVFEHHLKTLEASIQDLQRQHALVQLTLENGGEKPLRYFKERHILVSLTGDKRRDFIGRQLNLALFDFPVEANWKSNVWFWQETVLTFPETTDTNQIQVWLEFVDLLRDTSFQKGLNDSTRHAWKHQWQRRGFKAYRDEQDELLNRALGIAQQGEPSQGRYCQLLVQEFLDMNAKLMDRACDSSFPHFLFPIVERMVNPLFEPYWELLGRLKGRHPTTMWCKLQTLKWILEGLRWKLGQDGFPISP
jgi:DNA-binding transcriptional MerR regulator